MGMQSVKLFVPSMKKEKS